MSHSEALAVIDGASGSVDGRMDGRMGGWMDGWRAYIYIYTHLFTYYVSILYIYVLTNMLSLLCLYRGNIPNLMVSKARQLVILVRGEAPIISWFIHPFATVIAPAHKP